MSQTLNIPDEIDLADFIAKEAHDLKSPFNRGLGFLKLVLKGMDGPISDQAREDLSTAYQSALYSLALMNGLVEMAHLSRGGRDLYLNTHQVDHQLRQVMVEWKRFTPKPTDIDIQIQAPPTLFVVDELRFRQCIANWISFVVEYAQEETAVEIRVEDDPGGLRFFISSSGKKLRPPPACDLTLYGYVARRLLEAHQGKMEKLEETEGGACVEFIFPKVSTAD